MLEQRAANLFLIVSVEAIQRSIAVEIDQTCTKFADTRNLIVWEALPVGAVVMRACSQFNVAAI